MAELKISQFCSLATSPSWHTWLYHYDTNIYNNYIVKLRESRGCTYNRQLMMDTLDLISDKGGYEQILDYIRSNYPYMVVDDEYRAKTRTTIADEIFPYYKANILTFPRRVILDGQPDDLAKRIQAFTFDKLKHDSIIVGNRGYVEYLTKDDVKIAEQLPLSSWLIAHYRKNKV